MRGRGRGKGSSGGGGHRAGRWEDRGFRATAADETYISGVNGIRECLLSPHVKVREVWVDVDRCPPELRDPLRKLGDLVQSVKVKDTPFGPLTQGVAARVSLPRWPLWETLVDELIEAGEVPFLVALDQVEDPQNLGQILRTCEGAGVHAVLFPEHRAARLTQTVAQISQGAFAWLPLLDVGNLRNCLEYLKERGVWITGCDAAEDAVFWNQVDFTGPSCIVLGAEGKGLRRLTLKMCDQVAQLPMKGKVQSLNVGAATSAFVYEVARQRM